MDVISFLDDARPVFLTIFRYSQQNPRIEITGNPVSPGIDGMVSWLGTMRSQGRYIVGENLSVPGTGDQGARFRDPGEAPDIVLMLGVGVYNCRMMVGGACDVTVSCDVRVGR